MVSIVLPCYDHGKYVKDAIESVLNQTYTDFELFVFDNGSTDDSWKVIQEIEDPRMVKVKLEHNDLLEVKKQFIAMASGGHFAIMHSDDIWKREKLEKQIKFLDENKNARVWFTWSAYVDEEQADAKLIVNGARFYLEASQEKLKMIINSMDLYIVGKVNKK